MSKAPTAFGLLAAALLALCLATFPAAAATPKNALGAVAVSPDGGTIAAAGDNRVLYLVDAATLEVRERVPVGTSPLEIWYSADGSTLAMLTTDDALLFFETGGWTIKGELKDVFAVAQAAAADALVILGRPKKDQGGSFATPLKVVPLSGAAPTLEVAVAGEVASIAARPDASAFVALTKPKKDESETKEEPPSDLKGLDKEVFKLQHDQQASEVIVLDAAGVETGRQPSWFSQSGSLFGVYHDDTVHFLGYNNRNAIFTEDGGLMLLFEGPSSFNYALGTDAAQSRVAVGSLRQGGIVNLSNSAAVAFDIDQERGWPEYFKGYAFAPDGSLWGGTTSYRLVHIGADGKVIAIKPVF
jgi:hypothetical protein